MRHFRPIWTLALFLLLWTAAAPQAFASWACDGRVCSTGWSCCCALPANSRDGNCQATSPAEGARQSGLCPASCACVATMQSWDADRSAATVAVHAPVFQVVALPPPPMVLGPVPTERIARSHTLRGPPPTAIHLATPILRGPPALTLLSVGS